MTALCKVNFIDTPVLEHLNLPKRTHIYTYQIIYLLLRHFQG